MHNIAIPETADHQLVRDCRDIAGFLRRLSETDPEDIASMGSLRRYDTPPDCDADTLAAIADILEALPPTPATVTIRPDNDQDIRQWLGSAVDATCRLLGDLADGSIHDRSRRLSHADNLTAQKDALEEPRFALQLLQALSCTELAEAFEYAKQQDEYHETQSLDDMHRLLATSAINALSLERMPDESQATAAN